MEDIIYLLLGLLGLAFPAAGVVALILVSGARRRLRKLESEFADLRLRLDSAEAAPRTAEPPASVDRAVPVAPIPFQLPLEAPAPPALAAAEPPLPQPPPGEPAPAGEPAMPLGVSPPPQAAPAAPSRGFEELFGTRAVVWVGGIALVLGGVFLVQYSIEQGFLGPPVRVLLGALLAVALLAAGEYVRRYAARTNFVGVPAADVPSILTAAGTTVAFVTVYGAYALYGFLDPAAAFLLLGAVALAALAAALVHGPWLAGLGLVGAFATPALVASTTPNYWALALYVLVVTAATYVLARLRHWRWLALAGVVLGALWMVPGIADPVAEHALAFHAVAGVALIATFIVSGLWLGPDIAPGRIEVESSGALVVYLAATALFVAVSGFATVPLVAFVVLAGATVAIAGRAESATGAVPASAILAVLLVASGFTGLGSEAPGDQRQMLIFGAGMAILYAATGFAAQAGARATAVAIVWSATAAFAPVAILVALYVHVAGSAVSLPFAAAALATAALYASATERLFRRPPRPGSATAAALFATAAIASLALALTFGLEGGWLSVGLALMVPGIAWIATVRPLPALRWLVATLVVVVMARIAWEPRIVADPGALPIFNWLLYGYGVPAAAFWLGGFLLRRRDDDAPARIADAGAILFTVLLLSVEIRHYATGGDIYATSAGLAEAALQVLALLALAIGLERLRVRTGSIVHDVGALVVAGLGFAAIVGLLVLFDNPWWSPVDVGGPVLNLILLGYLVPAILIVVLATVTRATRPAWYHTVAIATATGLGLLYLLLETARLFRGPVLALGPVSASEQYAFSAVTLAYGVALLLLGIATRSQVIRFASAAVVLVATAKVFVVDLSGLTGPFRALSFIGLGLALVGIGWLYQRLLFSHRPVPLREDSAA
jgi:uncharacterized membrane protein